MEHKQYLGREIQATQLAAGTQTIACQAIDTVSEYGAGRFKQTYKIPNLFLISNVNLGPTYMNVTYSRYPGMGSHTALLMPDFKLKILTGQQADTMLAAFQAHRIENLSGQLYYGNKLGSDPEIFVEDGVGNLIPAFEFLGSKTNPNIRHSRGESPHKAFGKYGVYWDGFQAEFETEAISCMAWHMDSVQAGLEATLVAARKYNPKAILSNKNVYEISHEVLQKTPKQFVELGCKPSLNAYDMHGQICNPRELVYRPAGGHIHFGIGGHAPEEYVKGVEALDAILGVTAVSFFANYDNPIRRQYYGLAGEYRLPPHGLEYRTLSNAWLIHPAAAHMIFELGRSALMFGLNGFMPYWEGSKQETIEIINNCDVDGARKILDRNKVLFNRILQGSHLVDEFYGDDEEDDDEEIYAGEPVENSATTMAYNAFTQGVESIVADPDNIEKNWRLGDHWESHSYSTNACWERSVPTLRGKKLI